MDSTYPAGPVDVPEDLTRPTGAYRSRALFASVVLVLFIGTYFALTAYFGWKTYVLTMDMLQGGFFQNLQTPIVTFASAFFTLFLIKGLFFIKHSDIETDIEVTPESEPALFEFLYKLADDAGAPRPHRVFLSGRVNAAVYYDLSPLNLIVPTRKNLEIGLPLVNALTLSELKAVLAHEFGHFAQRSMAVGRWVYTAQQVANYLIYKRDIMDKFLNGLSRIDLRVAWIGWIMSLIVWSLRALLDSVFSLVVMAQRSLSRQMEFNADLVAVSMTGSDALVNALHKLSAADDCWDRTLSFAQRELNQGRIVPDLFIVQRFVTRSIKQILNDEYYDTAPPIPVDSPGEHRVFESENLLPPQMWATHPVSRAREDNAKATYIPAPLDDRPAWQTFNDPKSLRLAMTRHILNTEAFAEEDDFSEVPVTEVTDAIKQAFGKTHYHRRFRGVYLSRELTRHCLDVDDLYCELPKGELKTLLRLTYSQAFADAVESWGNTRDELYKLEALKDGRLKPPDGVIRHRGKDVSKSDLPELIEDVGKELKSQRQAMDDFDRRCRTLALEAAKQVPGEWDGYLRNLLKLLHYGEHALANLEDAKAYLDNLWAVVIADQKVSSSERKKLLEASGEVYQALLGTWQDIQLVALNPHISKRLGVSSWLEMLPEDMTLLEPTEENMGNWLEIIDGWLGAFIGPLRTLNDATLQELLASEFRVQRAFELGKDPGRAPQLNVMPLNYQCLLEGQERAKLTRLPLWDRFVTADGLLPGLTRFAVAASIVGAVIWFGQITGMATVAIYNGLLAPVQVTFGAEQFDMLPDGSLTLEVETKLPIPIEVLGPTGDVIDSLEVVAENSVSRYIYNVAGASPLLLWHEVYGDARAPADKPLGNPRWTTTDADYLFEDPPEEITTYSGSDGGTRSVVSGLAYVSPQNMTDYISAEKLAELALIRAKYDAANSDNIYQWINQAGQIADRSGIARDRLMRNPNELMAKIVLLDEAADDDHAELCADHTLQSGLRPGDADLHYLAVSCKATFEERRDGYYAGHAAWPEHGFTAYRAAQYRAYEGTWAASYDAFVTAFNAMPSLRSSIVNDLARVSRVTGDDTPELMRRLADYSDYVNFIYALESRDDLPDAYLAYPALHRGDFQQAVSYADGDAETTNAVNWLIAASDTASEAQIVNMLADETFGTVDETTVFSAVALALKYELDTTPLVEPFRDSAGQDSDLMFDFSNLLVSDEFSYDAAEQLLSGADPIMRGFAYSMAITYFGEQAPPQWRLLVSDLLFTYERPYFSS